MLSQHFLPEKRQVAQLYGDDRGRRVREYQYQIVLLLEACWVSIDCVSGWYLQSTPPSPDPRPCRVRVLHQEVDHVQRAAVHLLRGRGRGRRRVVTWVRGRRPPAEPPGSKHSAVAGRLPPPPYSIAPCPRGGGGCGWKASRHVMDA